MSRIVKHRNWMEFTNPLSTENPPILIDMDLVIAARSHGRQNNLDEIELFLEGGKNLDVLEDYQRVLDVLQHRDRG